MAGNSFGTIFRLTSFGESHGAAIGGVIDGCPSNIEINLDLIQAALDRRKPGQSSLTTQRKEEDLVQILSGVMDGKTLGTPIGFLIQNKDQRSKDYGNMKETYRPSHADFTYQEKYGIRDYRGGGRSSARETAMRVAAGAIARKVIKKKINSNYKITGALVQVGNSKIDYKNWNDEFINQNDFFSPDEKIIKEWEELIIKARNEGSSLGAIIELRCNGMPVGLGEPTYEKLDANLAKAIMSINAVKGVEIGNGFESVGESGLSNVDEMRIINGKPAFLSNNNGGILGGISTGQDLIVRFCVKPTSSISSAKKTINTKLKEIEISTKGRHDPCVGIRAVPVGEAMMATTLADHCLRFL
jgi:chorismate synthase